MFHPGPNVSEFLRVEDHVCWHIHKKHNGLRIARIEKTIGIMLNGQFLFLPVYTYDLFLWPG